MAFDTEGFLKALAADRNADIVPYMLKDLLAGKATAPVGQGFKFPSFNLPSLDLSINGPKLGIQGPDLGIQGIKMPEVNMPQLSLPQGPSLSQGLNMQMPDVQLKAPEIGLPQVNLPQVNLPQVSLPEINAPQLQLPSVGMPNIQNPNIQLPGMNLPQFELPKIDLSGLGLPKMPDLKLPDISGLMAGIPKPLRDAVEIFAPGVKQNENGVIELKPTQDQALKMATQLGNTFGIPGLAEASGIVGQVLAGLGQVGGFLSNPMSIITTIMGYIPAFAGLTAALAPILGPLAFAIPLIGSMVQNGEHTKEYYTHHNKDIQYKGLEYQKNTIAQFAKDPEGWKKNYSSTLDPMLNQWKAMNNHYVNTQMSPDLDDKYRWDLQILSNQISLVKAIGGQLNLTSDQEKWNETEQQIKSAISKADNWWDTVSADSGFYGMARYFNPTYMKLIDARESLYGSGNMSPEEVLQKWYTDIAPDVYAASGWGTSRKYTPPKWFTPAPVQQAPVQQAPVQQAPVQQVLLPPAPLYQEPLYQEPVQQAPVNSRTQEIRKFKLY